MSIWESCLCIKSVQEERFYCIYTWCDSSKHYCWLLSSFSSFHILFQFFLHTLIVRNYLWIYLGFAWNYDINIPIWSANCDILLPKRDILFWHLSHTTLLMFCTIPTIGTCSFWNIVAPLRATCNAASCGVVTNKTPYIHHI